MLPDRYADLVESGDVGERFRDAVPRVREMAEELASYGVPETLQHDDLHDGQVFVKGDRQLILDWGDALVSHPFFTLSVTLEGVIAWGLDDVESSVDIAPLAAGYLRRYAPDRPDFADAIPVALRLGWGTRGRRRTASRCSWTGGSEAVRRARQLMPAPQLRPIISHSLVGCPVGVTVAPAGGAEVPAWAEGPTSSAASTSAAAPCSTVRVEVTTCPRSRSATPCACRSRRTCGARAR